MTISTLNSMTSGTSSFNLNLTELCEEAYERAGFEMRSGYDLRTARRSLNLLFADWANRGINMWTIEQGTITLQQGLNTYALPTDTVDLLDHVIRVNPNNTSTQSDLTITRISVSTYATLPNKLTQGKPIQVWVQRLDGQIYPTGFTVASAVGATDTTITLTSVANLASAGFVNLVSSGVTETIYYNYVDTVNNILGNCFRGQNGTTASSFPVGAVVNVPNLPAITVWPTPDNVQTYQFVYWRMRRTQDASQYGNNVMDVPFRFVPAMAAGLAYYVALKVPDGMQRLPVLKQQYDEFWELAAYEDHEKAALRLVPRQMFIGGGF
jgi:hypothetical protein